MLPATDPIWSLLTSCGQVIFGIVLGILITAARRSSLFPALPGRTQGRQHQMAAPTRPPRYCVTAARWLATVWPRPGRAVSQATG